MPQAVSSAELRKAMESVPGLTLPAGLADGDLDTLLARQTAVVLTLRGLSDLPTAGSLEEDLVKNAVLSLTVVQVKRFLRPDDAPFLRALVEEEKLVRRDLAPLEHQGVPQRFLEAL